MRIPLLASIILSFATSPALAAAQADWDDASEATDVAPDEEAFAEEETGETAAPGEVNEASEPEETASEATEPDAPPPASAAKEARETKAEAKTVIFVTAEQPEEAKKPTGRLHDGFYLRGSLGPGWMAADFTEGLLAEGRIRGSGGAFDIQLGGSPTAGLVVGGGLFVNGMDHEDVRTVADPADADDRGNVTMLAIGPFIDYFPDATGGFHIGGMLGLAAMGFEPAGYEGDEPLRDDEARAGGGGAIGAWVGYDWWVGREWSLGAQLRYLGMAVENQDSDWRGAADAVALQFTVLYH